MPDTFLPRIFYLPVPPKNTNIKIYVTVRSPIILYRHVIWSIILRAEQRLREFVNTMFPKIFEPKWDEVTREWRKWFHEDLHGLYFSPDGIRVLTLWERDEHVGLTGRAGVPRGFWGRNLKDIDRLEYLNLDGRIILNLILNDSVGRLWTILIWRSIGTSGGPLWTQ
jgi:hypothetical protein